MVTPLEERAWWDEIAHSDELERNIYDHSLGTTDDCLAEIIFDLAPAMGPGARVLDLGCGTGRLLLPLAKLYPGMVFYGVDISTAMLRIVRTNATARHLENVRLSFVDGRHLPAPLIDTSYVDAAYSMGVFQHLSAETCAGYVREVARLLRPGGVFRFQDVIGEADGFLSHHTNEAEMTGWCEDPGLEVTGNEPSRLHWEWRWMTAKKP